MASQRLCASGCACGTDSLRMLGLGVYAMFITVCICDLYLACDQAGEGLTALRFDDSGLQCAVGTTNGLVALFDLRSSRPSIVKDHMYGAPIIDIKFHASDSMAGTPPAYFVMSVLQLKGLEAPAMQVV